MKAASTSHSSDSGDGFSVLGNTTKEHLQRSFDAVKEVDEACTAFESSLRRGQPLNIKELIANANDHIRDRLFSELLSIEMEFLKSRGETPSIEQYRNRFPEQWHSVKHLYLEHFTPAHVGDFPVQRLVGRGGFGHVYQAWDQKLSRSVAIKVFRREPEKLGRQGGLLLEARTVARLRHPGIVTVYAILPDADGDEFLVLEYVDGNSLEDTLRSGRLGARESASLILAVVQALQHAHQHGLVHRDLKPANILLEQGVRPRVTDFGLALHLTDVRRSPAVAGTLAYMAPEQANGESHRLDARTDLWSVGVVLYRMLTGRLPFTAKSNRDLLQAIQYLEPADPLALDSGVPPELARIAMRCLSKRMSDRYQTAAELAEDLSAYLSGGPANGTSVSDDRQGSRVAVVPKGLRHYDVSDRHFFLQLVPGPRDRHGIPQSIRFWEERLSECDPYQSFRVGLLYGPSGCGKSSLVRAGILPRLLGNIRCLLVESTRDDTEAKLNLELRRHFPDLPTDWTLSEILAELREGTLLPPGDKLVIVVDQFEQWLHGWQHEVVTPLVDALRQCNGGRVQAIVLVRDDFWMQATRFFKLLDVPLLEGINAAAVDLFDVPHAKQVLAAFGEAYQRLSSEISERLIEQERFLDLAVKELSDDGWVVPIRLCIFAEMVKSRAWVPATLREVGGADGLGVAYLDEAFNGRTAAPMHRLHRKAARAVLELLLPPAGADIRGYLKSESELQSASGYAQAPGEFASLMRCLDRDLRLITPSDAEGIDQEETVDSAHSLTRLYQLTHDFLVDAIRRWLNAGRQRSVKGRAEICLSERAQAYANRHDARQLPSWWEWLSISFLTRSRRWTQHQRKMMHDATWRYGLRASGAMGLALLFACVVYDRLGVIRAEGLVQALATSDHRGVPAAVDPLNGYSWWAASHLNDRMAETAVDSDARTQLMLGSLALGNGNPQELQERLLNASPSLAIAIVQVMQRYGILEQLKPRLQHLTSDPNEPGSRRLRGFVALAHLDDANRDRHWDSTARIAAAAIVDDIAQNPSHYEPWESGFKKVRQHLVAPLSQMFVDPALSRQEQLLVTQLVVSYASDDDSEQLLDLALQAKPWQSLVLFRALEKHADALRPILLDEVGRVAPADATEDQRDRLASRAANAILLLQHLGDDKHLWPALKYSPDPRSRSYVLRHFHEVAAPLDWMHRLPELDSGTRQAVVLALGCRARISSSLERVPELQKVLLDLFRTDPDAGVHSATEWALRNLGREDLIQQAKATLSENGIQSGFGWYVTKSGITMVIVHPSGKVQLGSPVSEPGHESDEGIWEVDTNWTYAISATEITQEQYQRLIPDYRYHLSDYAPTQDSPATSLTWLETMRFCRLLSEAEGMPESEIVPPPLDELSTARYPDILARSGYRLPTECEWEVACRSGTTTPRYFGNDPDLLPLFACYASNFGGTSAPVGRFFPNALGCFDTLGNVAEWCYNVYQEDPSERWERHIRPPGYSSGYLFGVRGNDFFATPRVLRSANRREGRSDERVFSRGFRIAHTVK